MFPSYGVKNRTFAPKFDGFVVSSALLFSKNVTHQAVKLLEKTQSIAFFKESHVCFSHPSLGSGGGRIRGPVQRPVLHKTLHVCRGHGVASEEDVPSPARRCPQTVAPSHSNGVRLRNILLCCSTPKMLSAHSFV